MYKKLAILTLSAILLGGCTLSSALKTSTAMTDSKLSSPTPTPTPRALEDSDPVLSSVPPVSTSSDDKSLETDIGNTQILDEDFSNLD